MESPSPEILQKCKPIIDLVEADVKQAMIDIEFCTDMEKCNEWKRKYLGKDSVIGQVLKSLSEWKV